MQAGYSRKPLIAKLGIIEGFRVVFTNAPAAYQDSLGDVPSRGSIARLVGLPSRVSL